MKSLLLLFCILQSPFLFSQSKSDAKYHFYTNKIAQFAQPSKVLYNHIDSQGNGSVEYTNAKKQILRFRVLNHKLQVMHGGISFQLFSYEDNYLQKIETFDANGNLAGERESQNEAVIVFIVEKKGEYLKKKKLIDDAEGNINMKDDSKEKIIRIKCYDANNLPTTNMYINFISSKTYYDYSSRMYWP